MSVSAAKMILSLNCSRIVHSTPSRDEMNYRWYLGWVRREKDKEITLDCVKIMTSAKVIIWCLLQNDSDNLVFTMQVSCTFSKLCLSESNTFITKSYLLQILRSLSWQDRSLDTSAAHRSGSFRPSKESSSAATRLRLSSAYLKVYQVKVKTLWSQVVAAVVNIVYCKWNVPSCWAAEHWNENFLLFTRYIYCIYSIKVSTAVKRIK